MIEITVKVRVPSGETCINNFESLERGPAAYLGPCDHYHSSACGLYKVPLNVLKHYKHYIGVVPFKCPPCAEACLVGVDLNRKSLAG